MNCPLYAGHPGPSEREIRRERYAQAVLDPTYINEQYAHTAELSEKEPKMTTEILEGAAEAEAPNAPDGLHLPEIPGPNGTVQLALVAEPTYGGHENEPDDEFDDPFVPTVPDAAPTAAPKLTGAADDGTFDHDCTLCPLHGRAHTTCVAGEGPKEAAIMVLGQAPNSEEDFAGRPFIGEAGDLLRGYCTAAELDYAQLFVSSAVKCATNKGRAPSKKEMAACATYMVREIATIRPQVIVVLGNVPLQALCGLTGIMKERGKQQRFSDAIRKALNAAGVPESYEPYILPTVHPAAVLQSPRGASLAVTIVEDFRLAAAQISGAFNEVEVPWGYLDDYTAADARSRTLPVADKLADGTFAYDIETNALPTYDPNFRIRMLSIDGGTGKVAVFRGASVLGGIEGLNIIHDAGGALVGHNAAGFDRNGILARTGVNLRNTDDTMLMAHLLDEEAPKNLQDLCVRHLRVRPWKDEVTWSWADGPQTAEEWELAGLYSARDSRYTRMLDEKLRGQLAEDLALHDYYTKLFLPLTRALSIVEANGVTLSLDKIGYAIGEFTMQKIKAEATVRRIVGDPEFNPGSAKQMREFLFNKLGLPVQDWTDGDEASTNELSLKKLRAGVTDAQHLDFIQSALDYRQASKMLGTYLEKYARMVLTSPDHRVHFWYSVIQAVSRSSSDGQQIPRDPRVRGCVSAPPGMALVQADFSQMELRIAAHLSQDPELLRVYREGGDIHRSTASAITGKPEHEVTDAERSDAKPWNFALLYGAEEYTVESILLKDFDTIIPRSETTYNRNAFHERYRGLQTWYNAVWQEARATSQIRTLTGRVRRLPQIHSSDDYKRVEALRQAINFTDQALGFDIAGIGLILAIGMGLKVTWFLHDAIYVECPVVEVDAVKAKIKQIEAAIPGMLDSMFGIQFSVPLPMDITVKIA